MEQLNDLSENEWINWLEEAIKKEHIKYYRYNQFKDIKIIGSGGFGKVFQATWKNTGNILALKAFEHNMAIKEIINEVSCPFDYNQQYKFHVVNYKFYLSFLDLLAA